MKLVLVLLGVTIAANAWAGNTLQTLAKKDVVRALQKDVNGDGRKDIIALAEPSDKNAPDYLSLWVKLSGDKEYFLFPDISYNLASTRPGLNTELSVDSEGIITIQSYNHSLGRARWSEKLNIAFNGTTFGLLKYEYKSGLRETKDLRICTIDLQQKTGVLSGSQTSGAFAIEDRHLLPLSEYTNEKLFENFVSEYCDTIEGDEGDFPKDMQK